MSSSYRTKTIAMLVCLSSSISASRVALAGGPPNVKPVAFLSIASGMIGGPVFGFAAGFLGMLTSDLFFGVGPWTLVTSCSMGAIGFLGGVLDRGNSPKSRLRLAIAGFVCTALYDISSSVLLALMFGYSWFMSIIVLYVPFLAGSIYPFGIVHGLTTAILLSLAGPPLIRQSRRIIPR